MVTVLVFGLQLDAPRNVQTRDEDGLLEELGQAICEPRLVLARRLDHAQPRLEFAHLPRPSAALARLAQHIPLVKRREFDHVLEFGIEGLVLEAPQRLLRQPPIRRASRRLCAARCAPLTLSLPFQRDAFSCSAVGVSRENSGSSEQLASAMAGAMCVRSVAYSGSCCCSSSLEDWRQLVRNLECGDPRPVVRHADLAAKPGAVGCERDRQLPHAVLREQRIAV